MKRDYLKHFAATAALLLVAGSAYAHDAEIGGIYYNLVSENREATVTYIGEYYGNKDYSGNVSIPSTIVYEEVPYDVTSIGSYAFYGCSELTSLTIPSSVTSIGERAFVECSGLSSVTIPESVTKIGYSAFENCTGLTSVVIPGSMIYVDCGIFSNCTSLQSVTFSEGIKEIGMDTFSGCTSLRQISFPSTLVFIHSRAFDGCEALTRVDYASVEQLCTIKYGDADPMMGPFASDNPLFYAKHIYIDGEELTDLVIPSTITEINDNAFANCSSLKSVYIPSSVKSIGYNAFLGCTALTDLNIPSSVVQTGTSAIDKSLEKYLPLEDGIRYAGRCAYSVEDKTKNTYTLRDDTKWMTPYLFRTHNNLTSFDIPEGVTSIEEGVFDGCHNLQSVMIPEGVTIIKSGAFTECALTSIVLPRSLKKFEYGEMPFYECRFLKYVEVNSDIIDECGSPFGGYTEEMKITGDATIAYGYSASAALRRLTLGENVRSVMTRAFYDCTSLIEVVCHSLIPPVCQDNSFGDVSNCTLYVPEEAMSAYLSASQWSNFKEIKAIEKPSVSLVDATSFAGNGVEIAMKSITYTRMFSNTNWQALYVPFTMEFGEWAADFDIARINDIHQFDDDDNGTIDRTELEVIKVTSGSIEANTPYLIRAKEAGEKTFTLANRTLYKAEEKSYTVSSWNTLFTFTGTYSGVTGSDMVNNAYYALGDGALRQAASTDNALSPYRWYVAITDRNGAQKGVNEVKVKVWGEDPTGLGSLSVSPWGEKNAVYDLSGRRITKENATKGLYIVNGKKVMVR